MDKKKVLNGIRLFLIVASVLCLIGAAAFMFHDYRRETQVSDTSADLPVEISHRVLYISSYNPIYYSSAEKEEGLKESLYPKGIEYDIVYMDAKNFATEDDLLAFHDFLKRRISDEKNYEGVILGDDDALRFGMRYQEELFPGIPMVFFGVNDIGLAEEASQNPLIKGYFETDFTKEAIDTVLLLFPDTDRLVALHDESSAGLTDKELFYECEAFYPGIVFSDIDSQEMTEEEFEKTVSEVSGNAVFLYMTCYNDGEGNTASVERRAEGITTNTSLPVLRTYDGGVGGGVLGSVSVDFKEQGYLGGQLLSDMLAGNDVSSVQLDMDTDGKRVFDYRLLKSYGCNYHLLPADTEYVNRGQTFMERYGRILPAILLIGAALVLLLIGTNVNMYQVRIANKELEKTAEDLETSRKELEYRADYDAMLGLLNRRAATDQLDQTLKADSKYSILIIDIDDFKGVNECYGHEFADELLVSLSSMLMMMADENGWLLSRFGGDEFLLMIPDAFLTAEDPRVETLLQLFRQPFSVGEEMIIMSASIGISNSDGQSPPETLIINAEAAMYEAKQRGRNMAFLYADEMKRGVREENQIKAKLLDAFENDGFYMVYQPQIDAKTLEVSGYEALVRMKEPGLYPGQFIPVVEQSGWIARLGRVTTELVIKQLAAWRDDGMTIHPVSVNYSSKQMNDTGYLDFVKDLLTNYDIPSEYLEIEFTEGLFIERTKQAEELFARFKELGITLLMDDFGTGYSSLGYLTYIPVDIIKLDKSLVDAYLIREKDSFIHDVIRMMHDLGKRVIIEGVEEEWQFKRLCEFGADAIQGYYFSKPVPPDEAISFRLKKEGSGQ